MKVYRITILVVLAFLFAGGWQVFSTAAQGDKKDGEHIEKNVDLDNESMEKSWEQGPLELDVILQRLYIDGQMVEEHQFEVVWSLEDFWASYEDWHLVNQKEGQVIFLKEIDDLSPMIKASGYFGLDDKGRLTIFEGKPENNKAIQSFYQIDTRELESKQSENLKNGIKIQDKDQYVSLLQFYEQLSLAKTFH